MRRRTFLTGIFLTPLGAAVAIALPSLPTRPVMVINNFRLTDYEGAKRLHIYWNATAHELIALAPKTSWIAEASC